MRAVLRSPLLHFVLLGALAFVGRQLRSPAPDPVVITAAQIRQLRDDYVRATRLTPTADDDRALVARAVDDELLYRDALARGLDRDDRTIRWQLGQKVRFLRDADEEEGDAAVLAAEAIGLGLDRDDPVIRRMLVEKVRLLVKDGVAREAVTDDELRDYLARHADAYRAPARISFRHVFLSRARHGTSLDAEARQILDDLRAGTPAPRGDGFPLGGTLVAQTLRTVAAGFGDAFATALAAVPVGEWTGPLESSYGVHLVRVTAVTSAGSPPLAAVRERALAAVRRERARVRLAERLVALRRSYRVRIEWPS